jgi:exonuclease SbcC
MVPMINDEIARILNGIALFTIELELPDNSNSMEVYINYGDSRRIIELGSGMEKMMASIAIRVALINISSLPKTDMLIIDEGFSELDESNIDACGQLLRSLTRWFKNIIIITHIDTLKDVVDNVIDITRIGKDAKVNYA